MKKKNNTPSANGQKKTKAFKLKHPFPEGHIFCHIAEHNGLYYSLCESCLKLHCIEPVIAKTMLKLNDQTKKFIQKLVSAGYVMYHETTPQIDETP